MSAENLWSEELHCWLSKEQCSEYLDDARRERGIIRTLHKEMSLAYSLLGNIEREMERLLAK